MGVRLSSEAPSGAFTPSAVWANGPAHHIEHRHRVQVWLPLRGILKLTTYGPMAVPRFGRIRLRRRFSLTPRYALRHPWSCDRSTGIERKAAPRTPWTVGAHPRTAFFASPHRLPPLPHNLERAGTRSTAALMWSMLNAAVVRIEDL